MFFRSSKSLLNEVVKMSITMAEEMSITMAEEVENQAILAMEIETFQIVVINSREEFVVRQIMNAPLKLASFLENLKLNHLDMSGHLVNRASGLLTNALLNFRERSHQSNLIRQRLTIILKVAVVTLMEAEVFVEAVAIAEAEAIVVEEIIEEEALPEEDMAVVVVAIVEAVVPIIVAVVTPVEAVVPVLLNARQ
jgi:hypothetical protein